MTILTTAPLSAATNIVCNPGFEDEPNIPCERPDDYCYWAGNTSEIVGASQGITPYEGSNMLHFIYTQGCEPGPAYRCDVWQIIDITSYQSQISDGNALASASAYFNRVTGDPNTDTEFVIQLCAYEGDPCTFPGQWESEELAVASYRVDTDDDPCTWELAEVDLVLPCSTDFLVVHIGSEENVLNDTNGVEFDGHYADAVSVTIGTAPIIYVDANATGANNGSSWEDAFTDLQDALDAAEDCNQIWVAEGTYTPSRRTDPGDPRSVTFQLETCVEIYGGFQRGGGCWEDRDPATYETILSGDLDGNDVPVANPSQLLGEPTRAENAYHVVTGSGADESAILDGFSITAGNANGAGYLKEHGGGIYTDAGSPTVTNCVLRANSASDLGGGMYSNNSSNLAVGHCNFIGNYAATNGGGMYNGSSNVTVTSCNFVDNSAGSGAGLYNSFSDVTIAHCAFTDNSSSSYGGAIFNGSNSNLDVIDSSFSSNNGGSYGGAIYNIGTSTNMTRCTFVENSARYSGAVQHTATSTAYITNCYFIGNWSVYYGGGLYASSGSGPVIVTNCVFSGNYATSGNGGGIYNSSNSTQIANCTFSANWAGGCGGGIYVYSSRSPTIANCIFWANQDSTGINESSQICGGTPVVCFCDIHGLNPAGPFADCNNINADPLFVDADGADNIVGTEDDNLRLLPYSPCIDEANNVCVPPDTLDLDGDGDTTERTPLDLDDGTRFIDDLKDDTGVPDPPDYPEVVDMGAYEFLRGDIDYSGLVNSVDYVILASAWRTEPGDLKWDYLCELSVPPDYFIDWVDLAALVENWLVSK